MNVLSISEAARRRDCARSTIYRAIRDGRINALDTGSAPVIPVDEKWEAFEPKNVGFRKQKLEGDVA